MSRQSKNFQVILKEIHSYITENNLSTGDRLPSERDLVERLGVGRSSIREALKALELLGIISTRRGEGTYLEDLSSQKLIEILALFLIRDPRSTRELSELCVVLGADLVRSAMGRIDEALLSDMKEILDQGWTKVQNDIPSDQEEILFFKRLSEVKGNVLYYRIYSTMIEFWITANPDSKRLAKLVDLYHALQKRDAEQAITCIHLYFAATTSFEEETSRCGR